MEKNFLVFTRWAIIRNHVFVKNKAIFFGGGGGAGIFFLVFTRGGVIIRQFRVYQKYPFCTTPVPLHIVYRSIHISLTPVRMPPLAPVYFSLVSVQKPPLVPVHPALLMREKNFVFYEIWMVFSDRKNKGQKSVQKNAL